MPQVKWLCVMLAMAATGVWAQQSTPSPQPAQSTANPASPGQFKPWPPPAKGQIWKCPAKFEYHPEVDGIYTVGGDVKSVKLLHHVEAKFSDDGKLQAERDSNFMAVSILSVVVDAQGVPQDICVQDLAGYKLDGEAIKAVEQYRYRPATKDGVPVAVRITVPVKFRSY